MVFELQFVSTSRLSDIVNPVLGDVVTLAWAVEYQKRGPPHFHMFYIAQQ
jgi:hypothetical protein